VDESGNAGTGSDQPDPRPLPGDGPHLPIDPDLTPCDSAEPGENHVAGRATASRFAPATMGAVWVGGALGTVARYGVSKAWPAPAGGFPWAIFVINTSGAFALGLLLTVLFERLPHRVAAVRPFAATGILGGWTTFSTLVVGTDSLVRSGRPGLAIGYLVATLAAGLVAVTIGMSVGRRRPAALGEVPQ
jgi:fluoride exporter